MYQANSSDPIFMGIDGGGTNCRAWLYDATGHVIAVGYGGSANPVNGYESALRAIVDSAKSALALAGLTDDCISSLVVGAGLAGLHIPAVKTKLLTWKHPFAQIFFTTDLQIAAYGAHQNNDGALIILGTGFSAQAQVNKKIISIGGMGFPINAVASGSWFGLEAVKAVLLDADAIGEPTALTRQLLSDQTLQQLAEKMLGASPKEYAKLAPIVLTLAKAGDRVCMGLREQACAFVERVCSRLLQEGAPQITMVGGVAPHLIPFLEKSLASKITYSETAAQQGAWFFVQQEFLSLAKTREKKYV